MEDQRKYKEETQRYVFLKTAEKDGKPIALIADTEILGEGGVRSLQLAFNANAAPITRAGVLTLTIEQLKERLPELRENGLDKSAAAYRCAIGCLEKKTASAPVAKKLAQPTA